MTKEEFFSWYGTLEWANIGEVDCIAVQAAHYSPSSRLDVHFPSRLGDVVRRVKPNHPVYRLDTLLNYWSFNGDYTAAYHYAHKLSEETLLPIKHW